MKVSHSLLIFALKYQRLTSAFYDFFRTLIIVANQFSFDDIEQKKKIHQARYFINNFNSELTLTTMDDESIRLTFIKFLENNMTKSKTIRLILTVYPSLTYDYLETICGDYFSKYKSFVVFGCPHSTDIDVCCIIDTVYKVDGVLKPLHSSEELRLITELSSLGYNVNREIDINLICLDQNGDTIASSKGGTETQNIILMTHKYHKQMYPIPMMTFVEVDPFEKIEVICKFILDKLEFITIDYDAVRDRKTEVYKQFMEHKLLFCEEIVDQIQTNIPLTNIQNRQKWHDTMKSLTMKIIQLVLLLDQKYQYTKMELVDSCGIYFPELVTAQSNALYFLFRGTKGGDCSGEFIKIIYNRYLKIVRDHLNEMNQHDMDIFMELDDIQNVTTLSNTLFTEFKRNPLTYSNEFMTEFVGTYGNTSINSQFEIEVSDEATISRINQLLPSSITDHFVWINQRSPEWLNLLKYYKCGKNTGAIGSEFESKYNLIRGAISELIVMKYFDPSVYFKSLNEIIKCSVGLLVKKKEANADGCAPDMLLVMVNEHNEVEIVPIEIKSLKSSMIEKNSSYYRELKLAKKQLQSVKQILDDTSLIQRGLIILSYINDKFNMNIKMVCL